MGSARHPPRPAGLFAAVEQGHELGKKEFERELETLRVELLNLQFDLRSADFSVIVLIEGNDRPGCADLVHALSDWLDARDLDSYAFDEPELLGRPRMARYWDRLPPHGRTALFVGGWVSELISDTVGGALDAARSEQCLRHLERFERMLAEDGTLLLKFWLHLPEERLRKRLRKARKKNTRHWRLDEADWEILENYDEVSGALEQVVHRTDRPEAPWILVESTDARHRNLTVARHIRHALARRLELPAPPAAAAHPASDAVAPPGEHILDGVDLGCALEKKAYGRQLDELQAELNDLSRRARSQGLASVLVFEGWDAAGKGGTIRRLIHAMPVANYRVIRTAAPSEEERARHYLWRFWSRVPRPGRMALFDRSWYGRVLVERVEGFAREEEWRRAYSEIVDFEEQLLEHGIPLLKFWLHIDADEQLRRFEERGQTPYKKYKLTHEDLRNREKWAAYARAAHDMVQRTSSSEAPWQLVPANDKRWARIEVLRSVCGALAARLGDRGRGSD